MSRFIVIIALLAIGYTIGAFGFGYTAQKVGNGITAIGQSTEQASVLADKARAKAKELTAKLPSSPSSN
jgi:pyruvate carboxylase